MLTTYSPFCVADNPILTRAAPRNTLFSVFHSMPESMTFGSQIAEARKALGLSQKDLASKITKEDGEPISPQYLNDIEHDRRNPPSEGMIYQFAKELKIEPEVLFYLAGKLPQDLTKPSVEREKIVAAYQAFRKALKK